MPPRSLLLVSAAILAASALSACNKNTPPADNAAATAPSADGLPVTGDVSPTSSTQAASPSAATSQPAQGGSAPTQAQPTAASQDYADDAAPQGNAQPVYAPTPPPPLPVYEQPPAPEYGDIWTPGYWAWGGSDYYWVPGTWTRPPRPGLLWTPGYWVFFNGHYGFHRGYWGPHVGFYGGVNYGFGYNGNGYFGGRWNGDRFEYNAMVNNIRNLNTTNIYRETVIEDVRNDHLSFNGGAGIHAAPKPEELAALREARIAATEIQVQHIQAARAAQALRAIDSHGRPAIVATAHPAVFSGAGVVTKSEAPEYRSPWAQTPRAEDRGGQRPPEQRRNERPEHRDGER